MLLNNLQNSQENTCVGVFFNKFAGPQYSNFIKKRLHHRYFPVKFSKFLRTSCFASPAAASAILRFPACIFFKKGDPDKDAFSVNFKNFLRTSFDRTPLDGCLLCLSETFEKFFRTPPL